MHHLPHWAWAQDQSHQNGQLNEEDNVNMQMKDVYSKCKHESLQRSLGHSFDHLHQAASPHVGNLNGSSTPTVQYNNPRVNNNIRIIIEVKRSNDYTTTSTLKWHAVIVSPPTHSWRKGNTMCIDMLGQMWLGCPMHEAIALKWGLGGLLPFHSKRRPKKVGCNKLFRNKNYNSFQSNIACLIFLKTDLNKYRVMYIDLVLN